MYKVFLVEPNSCYNNSVFLLSSVSSDSLNSFIEVIMKKRYKLEICLKCIFSKVFNILLDQLSSSGQCAASGSMEAS